jgi:hypothetical protein
MSETPLFTPPERDERTWIQTFTARKFWPLNPRPEEVDIRDIAHGLSQENRYNGMCRFPYSVGQHCLLASTIVAPEFQLLALMHDATEAYTKDILRPIKRWEGMSLYLKAEEQLHHCIAKALDFSPEMPPEVKYADTAMLGAERRVLMAPPPAPWIEMVPAADVKIVRMSAEEVENKFLMRFCDLKGISVPPAPEWTRG